MRIITTVGLLAAFGVVGTMARVAGAAEESASRYFVYVACESQDEVALVRFDPTGGPNGAPMAEAIQRIPVGVFPTEIEGPHGLCVSPDGKYWYLSIAHGIPFGNVYKFTTGDNRELGHVTLGLFPATMQVSPATGLLYVVNFNLHGDPEPSSVSVVDPAEMVEVARITTGVMPHGSRLSPDGLRHYSCAMMSDMLYEIDAVKLDIKRELHLDMDHDSAHHESSAGHHGTMPTWVQLHPKKPLAYVALNGSDEIAEVDLKEWKIARRFKPPLSFEMVAERGDAGKRPKVTADGTAGQASSGTQDGTAGQAGSGTQEQREAEKKAAPAKKLAPYNVEITPDGTKLVVTYKAAGAIGFWDLETGKELARTPTSRAVSHGIAITPDNRYAIVTAEGKGDQPGSVDVFDLSTFQRIATADVGKQAGGIAFWKMEASN